MIELLNLINNLKNLKDINNIKNTEDNLKNIEEENINTFLEEKETLEQQKKKIEQQKDLLYLEKQKAKLLEDLPQNTNYLGILKNIFKIKTTENKQLKNIVEKWKIKIMEDRLKQKNIIEKELKILEEIPTQEYIQKKVSEIFKQELEKLDNTISYLKYKQTAQAIEKNNLIWPAFFQTAEADLDIINWQLSETFKQKKLIENKIIELSKEIRNKYKDELDKLEKKRILFKKLEEIDKDLYKDYIKKYEKNKQEMEDIILKIAKEQDKIIEAKIKNQLKMKQAILNLEEKKINNILENIKKRQDEIDKIILLNLNKNFENLIKQWKTITDAFNIAKTKIDSLWQKWYYKNLAERILNQEPQEEIIKKYGSLEKEKIAYKLYQIDLKHLENQKESFLLIKQNIENYINYNLDDLINEIWIKKIKTPDDVYTILENLKEKLKEQIKNTADIKYTPMIDLYFKNQSERIFQKIYNIYTKKITRYKDIENEINYWLEQNKFLDFSNWKKELNNLIKKVDPKYRKMLEEKINTIQIDILNKIKENNDLAIEMLDHLYNTKNFKIYNINEENYKTFSKLLLSPDFINNIKNLDDFENKLNKKLKEIENMEVVSNFEDTKKAIKDLILNIKKAIEIKKEKEKEKKKENNKDFFDYLKDVLFFI